MAGRLDELMRNSNSHPSQNEQEEMLQLEMQLHAINVKQVQSSSPAILNGIVTSDFMN